MKKLDKKSLRGFIAGLTAALALTAVVFPAQAMSALQEIKVSIGGISLFIDGKLQVPTDIKGNAVEPLIYAGTTYLPVRAVVGMLTDKPVEWDAKTESVYIGKKPGPGQTVRMDTLTTYNGNYTARVGEDAQYSILGDVQTPFNTIFMSAEAITYKLDSGYTTLQGELVIQYSELGSKQACKLAVYSIDKYGVETLLDSFETIAGDDPVDVSVNVRGCDFIKIAMEQTTIDDYSGSYGAFFDVTLTTATAG